MDKKAANTIRFLSADMVQKANSGHPGLPMGMADAAFALWSRHLRFNPKNPNWFGRDRFVLSAGHGSALLYSLLHLFGYDLSIEDLKHFRQLGSKTPGHPELKLTPGVETATGPLGQGFANGVGMALAAHHLESRFNKKDFSIINHYVYGIASDGDLMEGISSEAASLAGHLKLDRLIYLYDDNDVTLDTLADESYTENWQKRFESYGWHVQSVDGMDEEKVSDAIYSAKESDKPSIIGCKTIIGYGAPNKQGTAKAHGEPLGEDELVLAKKKLGWPEDKSFFIPDDVKTYCSQFIEAGEKFESEYTDLFKEYESEHPEEARQLQLILSNKLPDGWKSNLATFGDEQMATRNASSVVINSLAKKLPNFIGGSADLAGSNKTTIESDGFIQANDYSHRNIRFGVREHAMAGILNGVGLSGLIPYGGTFLVFSDYMKASMRLAALMGIRVIYVLTHDSIGLGQDGPTHQPVEHLASLRSIPNMTVIRPSDANEVIFAWQAAIENTKGPTVIVLSRQDLPVFDRENEKIGDASNILKGGYVFYESTEPDIILISSGSEMQLAYQASQKLIAKGVGVRVVNLASWELFEKQSEEYRQSVLPESVPKIAIEAGSSFGWERWTGNEKEKVKIIGINRFGASAPGNIVFQEFEFTVENIVKQTEALIN